VANAHQTLDGQVLNGTSKGAPPMTEVNQKLGLDRPGIYQIRVPGRLDESWQEWFEGMEITVESGDGPTVTTLTGTVADEAALQGLLDRLFSLGLRLLSVVRMQPEPE
jgi:hypothetical protein